MAENIGTQIPTKIPSLSDNADIQAALRLYHYGQNENDENFDPSSSGTLNSASIAGYISSIQSDISDIQDAGYGSEYSDTMPTAGVADGYIWVDSTQSLGAQPGLVAAYQTSAPSNPVLGSLWVDSTDTNDLSLKVYDGTTWKVIV
jgi:hypothetical protein